MARLYKIKYFIVIFFIFFINVQGFSEIIIDKDYGYSFDLPEGFQLTEMSQDSLSYMFTHKYIPLNFVAKLYLDQEYTESEKALSTALTKLSANYDTSVFTWNNTESAIASFNMILDKEYSGWSVAAPIGKTSFIVLLCYAPAEIAPQCQDFIMSSLNSLCINYYFYNTPGIVTTFAYSKEGNVPFKVNIAGNEIKSSIDKIDSEAAQFVVDMEYRILTKYANNELMYEAWARYYKMIYRDCYGRIENFSKDVYETLYKKAETERPENPKLQYAQYLLSWVQTFKYTRAKNKNSSDFTNLPSILLGNGSDCDSRSMLVSAVLEYAGIDSLLLIYPEYAHALVAAYIPGAMGQTFRNPEDKKDYIMGETTAELTWGTIAKEQADKTKCFSISLPQY